MSTPVIECLNQFLFPDLSRIVNEYVAFAGVLSQKLFGEGKVTSLAVTPHHMISSADEPISGPDDDNSTLIRIWDLNYMGLTHVTASPAKRDVDMKPSRALNGHNGCVLSLAVLPNNRLASGSDDRTIRIWDFNYMDSAHVIASPPERNLNTETSYVLKSHAGSVRALAALPGNRLASGSDNENTIRIWDLNNMGLAHVIASPAERDLDTNTFQVLKGHTGWVWALAIMPNNRLAPGSSDKTIRIWYLDTKTSYFLSGHTGWIFALAVLPNNRLASGSNDRTIRIWDLNNKTSYVLEGHTRLITALAVLPDGRLVSGSHDRTIRIWDLTTRTGHVLCEHTVG